MILAPAAEVGPVASEAAWARDPSRRRSSRSSTGHLVSMRLEGGVHVFESRLERDCLMLFDVDHNLCFSSQPETFRWVDGGRIRGWTPDLRLVDQRDGTALFVEIKPAAMMAKYPDLQGRLPGMVERCAERGAGLAILTEREIRSGHALAVARRIRAAADRCDPATTALLLDRLSPVRLPKPLGALEALFSRPADRFALVGLLGRGLLRFDPVERLGPCTLVSKGSYPWR